MGNHDPQSKSGLVRADFAKLFHQVHTLAKIQVQVGGQPQPIVLCHYAMRVWDASHHGAWHLYGHSHGSLPDDRHALSWDVGVDNNNLLPLSVDEIAKIMATKTFRPIDHHGASAASHRSEQS